MKILFVNITWMKYYRGVTDDDKPVGGGAYIKKHGDGSDVVNFLPRNNKCYGFAMTRTLDEDRYAQIRIENLDSKLGKDVSSVDGVLVIWVAKKNKLDKQAHVVGWYRDAKVYRNFQTNGDYNYYNVVADVKNVVLLPIESRQWSIPRAGYNGNTHGLGQSNIWYGKHPDSQVIVDSIISKIGAYNGENWMSLKRKMSK